MSRVTALLITGALLSWSSLAQAKQRSPEEQLARATAGRVAGEAVDCIFLRDISSSEVIRDTAIVYRMNNGTIMINFPRSGAAFLERDNVLVTDTHSSQLCSIDVVRLLDASSHFPSGSVGLGNFVPYPRPRRAAAE